jgi:hypothetical protein
MRGLIEIRNNVERKDSSAGIMSILWTRKRGRARHIGKRRKLVEYAEKALCFWKETTCNRGGQFRRELSALEKDENFAIHMVKYSRVSWTFAGSLAVLSSMKRCHKIQRT